MSFQGVTAGTTAMDDKLIRSVTDLTWPFGVRTTTGLWPKHLGGRSKEALFV